MVEGAGPESRVMDELALKKDRDDARKELEAERERAETLKGIAEGLGGFRKYGPITAGGVIHDQPGGQVRAEGLRKKIAELDVQLDLMNDPDSLLSKDARQSMKDIFGVEIGDGATYSMITATTPQLTSILKTHMAVQGKESKYEKDAKGKMLKEYRREVRSHERQLSNAEEALRLLKLKTSTGDSAAIRMFLKSSGEHGRLTDQDMRDVKKRWGLDGIWDTLVHESWGALADQHRTDIGRALEEMTSHLDEKIKDTGLLMSHQYQDTYGLDSSDLYNMFTGSTGRIGLEKGAAGGGLILMVGPDGKVAFADPDDVERYEAKGWQKK
jgi:hypothetical protein